MFKLLPVPAFSLAALFLLPAVSHSETLVNGSFDPPAITGQAYDPTPVTDGPAGTFSFIATFCSTANGLGNRLESRTAELTGGNELLDRTAGSGATSVLAFPPTDGYADLDLAPGECVPVTYEIGLQQRAPFQFFVDIWFDAPTVYLFWNQGQPNSDTIRPHVDDFIVGTRSNPLVPGPTIKGVKWQGSNPIFNIDPGNEFRIKIFESDGCYTTGALGDRPKTAWDAPFYEAVVTASRVFTGVPKYGQTPQNKVYEYTASIPWFTPTAGCRYFLGIDNTFRRPLALGGDAAWAWAHSKNSFLEDLYSYQANGSNWSFVDYKYVYGLTD